MCGGENEFKDNKKPSIFMLGYVRADEGTRTPTVLLPLEPESSASANSATSARMISCETFVLARTSIIISQVPLKVNTFFKIFLIFLYFFVEPAESLCLCGFEGKKNERISNSEESIYSRNE